MYTTNPDLEALAWRYATKQYDKQQRVKNEDIEVLLESVRLAPSSYGLQPYKVLVVSDPKTKEALRAAAYDQSQLEDASHVLVFAAKKNIDGAYVQDYMKNMAETRELPLTAVEGFGAYIEQSISQLQEADFISWNSKQAYLALGILLQNAAKLRIDATPMEGFSKEEFDRILQLPEQGLTSAVICALGYRSESDSSAHYPKVRKAMKDLVQHIA